MRQVSDNVRDNLSLRERTMNRSHKTKAEGILESSCMAWSTKWRRARKILFRIMDDIMLKPEYAAVQKEIKVLLEETLEIESTD